MKTREKIVGIALLGVLIAGAAALARFGDAGALYPKLSNIIEKEDHTWPRTQNGVVDISQIVCPLVSADTLDQIYSHPAPGTHVTYHLIEKDPSGLSPVLPVKIWHISKWGGPFGNTFFVKVLSIKLAPGGGCEASYMRDFG